MILQENVENLAQQAVLDESQFITGVVVAGHGPYKITIALDGDRGVTIDDCASVSRRVLKLLDEHYAGEDFSLEVTTPGTDYPLKLKRQYIKNVGRKVKIQMKDKVVELGKLVEVTDDAIALEQEEKIGKVKQTKKIALPFSEIERAIVQVSFK